MIKAGEIEGGTAPFLFYKLIRKDSKSKHQGGEGICSDIAREETTSLSI